jgi:hypothetical protein
MLQSPCTGQLIFCRVNLKEKLCPSSCEYNVRTSCEVQYEKSLYYGGN